jgi:autotransporter-associated beta strand protein
VKDSHVNGPPVRPVWPRLLLAAALAFLTVPFAAAPAQAADDITSRVRAGEDVVLDGDAVVRLGDGEEIVYGGHFSGAGTLTVSGAGKLVLTADSDFAYPGSSQTVEARGEPWWWNTIENPDPPAVTVESGATLQYGDGTGSTGVIAHYPYELPNFEWNSLNHHVDGTLIVAVHGGRYHPGNLSGSGFIVQPRSTWDGLSLAGNHTFSGVLYNGTVIHYSQREFLSTMPEVDTVLNQGSFIIDTQDGNDTVLDVDFYSREWGNDINFHSQIFGSRVVMSGVYSWADSGPDHDPSLSDPSLNYEVVAHNHNKRGINIEGALVQWGDGTDNTFFLPGNRDTVYINMHARRMRSHLIFNYNGPVQLDAPISGGIYHATMDAVGEGDVTIAGTPGNDVTFADQQNYNGATTIESGAVLRLGSGEEGGDGWLLTGTDLAEVVDNGVLVVANTATDIELSRISGEGGVEQSGPAQLTFTGETVYTGPTTVSGGTLALTGGDIAASDRVDLTGDGAVLDLSQVQDQTVADLSGVAGAAVKLGAEALTVASAEDTAYAGAFEGEGALVKSGPGTWTFAGASAATGAWSVTEGALTLDNAGLAGALDVTTGLTVTGPSTIAGNLSLGDTAVLTVGTGTGAEDGSDTSAGADGDSDAGSDTDASVSAGGGLAVDGEAVLGGTLAVAVEEGAALPEEITVLTAAGGLTGTFDGLAEGAELDVAGTAYTVSYENSAVVLRTDTPREAEEASATGADAIGPLPLWVYVSASLIVLLLIGLGLLFWFRRRRRGGTSDDATLELPMVRPGT